MKHYVGLDVSVKETSVCIVDETGRLCREVKVASHPDDLTKLLCDPAWRIERVGLEAGPLSQWLFSGLAEAGVPAICIETRHAKAFLKAQVNKSDRNDARGIAQMMRVGLFRPVHVKTLTSQKQRVLLTGRKLLQEKAIAIENDIRGLLRNFGLKVGIVGIGGFEGRIRELVEGRPELADIMMPLLTAKRTLRDQFTELHRKVLLVARDHAVCRRLMTIPGVGPVTSLAFVSMIDVPARFKTSKAVGPSLGSTPVLHQSGESHRIGRISLCGDDAMRALLYEAADDLGSALDLAVEAFQRVRAVQLGTMLRREGHIGQHIGLGCVHQRRELRNRWPELVCDAAPLLACGRCIILGEGGGDEGRYDAPSRASGMGERIPHEVHPAALPGGGQHLRDSGLDALMTVGDDELDPAQPAPGQLAQEGGPEGLGLGGANIHAHGSV